MSSEFRALLWKEWHERKVQLALSTAGILCCVIYVVSYEAVHTYRTPVSRFYAACLLYGLFTAVILAMRTSLGEVTQKTLGFSAVLPVSLRHIAWVRLGGAIVVMAGPIILGTVLLSVVLGANLLEEVPPRPQLASPHLTERAAPSLSGLEAVGFLWKMVTLVVAQACELLLIVTVIGARRRTEAHVGFLGALVAFAWTLPWGLRITLEEMGNPLWGDWCGAILPQSLAICLSYGDLDGGSYQDLLVARTVGGPLALNLLVLAGLGALFVRRYGAHATVAAGTDSARFRWQLPAVMSRLPIRWPGRVAALAWLDLRQSLPLALAGLALACLMTVVGLMFESSGHSEATIAQAVAGNLPGSTWFVATLWATVVGSGLFAAELQPGLGHFWRSRPIHPSIWFCVKFLIGLAAVVGVLDGVTIFASWNSPYVEGANRMSRSYVACMPVLHATMYALAVLGVCWLRKPVFGAMAGVLTFFIVSLALESIPGARHLDPITVYNELVQAERGGVFNLADHGYPFVYGTMAAMSLIAAALAVPAVLRSESAVAVFRRSRLPRASDNSESEQ